MLMFKDLSRQPTQPVINLHKNKSTSTSSTSRTHWMWYIHIQNTSFSFAGFWSFSQDSATTMSSGQTVNSRFDCQLITHASPGSIVFKSRLCTRGSPLLRQRAFEVRASFLITIFMLAPTLSDGNSNDHHALEDSGDLSHLC